MTQQSASRTTRQPKDIDLSLLQQNYTSLRSQLVTIRITNSYRAFPPGNQRAELLASSQALRSLLGPHIESGPHACHRDPRPPPEAIATGGPHTQRPPPVEPTQAGVPGRETLGVAIIESWDTDDNKAQSITTSRSLSPIATTPCCLGTPHRTFRSRYRQYLDTIDNVIDNLSRTSSPGSSISRRSVRQICRIRGSNTACRLSTHRRTGTSMLLVSQTPAHLRLHQMQQVPQTQGATEQRSPGLAEGSVTRATSQRLMMMTPTA